MDVIGFINSINLFDLIVIGALIGMFILGFAQGVIRRLIGIISATFAYILAANLKEPVGDFLAYNWTQFPAEYSHLIGFGVIYLTLLVGLAIAAQVWYKPVTLWPQYPLLEEILGGFLGVVQGLLILMALVVITDPYFAVAGAPANGELGFIRSFHDALDPSATAAFLRQAMIPAFNALLGAFIPEVLRSRLDGS